MKSLIRDDPGSCLTCNVEGEDYSAALHQCRKKGKFFQCNRASAARQMNICELTERRNNGKVYLTATCNQKQACLNNQAQNKRQCNPFGAVDRKLINLSTHVNFCSENGIEKVSTCRQCFGVGRSVNSFLKKLESGKYDYSDYNRDFSAY